MYIHRALLKYGYSLFSLTILEYCSEENLIEREQYFIDTLKPDYNICTTAGSTLGKIHSDGAKEKISVSKKGTYSGEANHFYGKTHTDEARRKMTEAKFDRILSEVHKQKISDSKKGNKFSKEHRSNLSLAQPNRKKFSVTDLETGNETIFASIAEAERTLGFPKDSIRANLRLKNKTPYKGKYSFKVID
jgi:group I intron endonuclease